MTHITFTKDENLVAKEVEAKFKDYSDNYLKEKNMITVIKPSWHLIKTDDTNKPFSELLGEFASEKE